MSGNFHCIVVGVANGKSETAGLVFFRASLRHFDFSNCKTKNFLKYFKCECKTFRLFKLEFKYEFVQKSAQALLSLKAKNLKEIHKVKC